MLVAFRWAMHAFRYNEKDHRADAVIVISINTLSADSRASDGDTLLAACVGDASVWIIGLQQRGGILSYSLGELMQFTEVDLP